ncbi:hypothetical protein [Bacillus sp. 1NLA3E]|uniref:hypothetical protein n=1 Tax=Bacillus sp. 1NLA3E TaxID=666686 RepID=UPI000247F3EC|nr:hypothetical protein [Bacillus sp. 1NLA3E]AGK53852.1 hypothetical protein B1NLA3E_10470 [Bacillus sp. 1NLA3E]
MSFYLPFIIGFILLMGLIVYSIVWYTKKKTQKVRSKILSGEKSFLVHWTYDDTINIAEFQGIGSALFWYKKKLSDCKEVYICSDGILLGNVIFYSWNQFSKFKQLRIKTGNPPCIQFKIEFSAGESETIAEFFIPIPQGKQQEAESVLNTLYGMVQIDF